MYYSFVAVNIIEAEAMWFNDTTRKPGCVL
jgi:hypothetical protein